MDRAKTLRHFITIATVFLILTYPLFYFSYKYWNPSLGFKDFYSYHKLYKDWDYKDVESPFNQRIVSSALVHFLYKAGVNYDTKISCTDPAVDQQVLFCSVLASYLGVLLTCLTLYYLFFRLYKDKIFAFLAGLIYLFGYGTLFFELSGLTDSFSVFLMALCVYFYVFKSWWIIPVFIVSIFQREYIFFVFGLVALFDYLFRGRNKYFLLVFINAIIMFGVYYILRKTIFYTHHFDHQISSGNYLNALLKTRFDFWPYVKQSFFIQNLVFLYIIIVIYKKIRNLLIDYMNLVVIILLFVQIMIISFMIILGNNTGRYFYIATPLLIVYIANETYPLYASLMKQQNLSANE